MTDDDLHAIHAAAMNLPRPWTTTEITAMRRAPGSLEIVRPEGFLLARITLDEAELLTLAVHPNARRRGIGHTILDSYHHFAREKGAMRSFLEVAETNAPARALYENAGYFSVGIRPRYYRNEPGPPIDAILMAYDL